jgi:RecA-family ATPase
MSMPSLSTLGEATFTAAELMAFEFPEARWAVPGIIPEGVTLLAGKPKQGKSWASLGISIAVATGGEALGKVRVERGEVLYLALEDNPRRLQSASRSS